MPIIVDEEPCSNADGEDVVFCTYGLGCLCPVETIDMCDGARCLLTGKLLLMNPQGAGKKQNFTLRFVLKEKHR